GVLDCRMALDPTDILPLQSISALVVLGLLVPMPVIVNGGACARLALSDHVIVDSLADRVAGDGGSPYTRYLRYRRRSWRFIGARGGRRFWRGDGSDRTSQDGRRSPQHRLRAVESAFGCRQTGGNDPACRRVRRCCARHY